MNDQVQLIDFDGLWALVKCPCGCLNRGRRYMFAKPCTVCNKIISFHDLLKDLKNPINLKDLKNPVKKIIKPKVKLIKMPIMKINIPKSPKPMIVKVPKLIIEKKVRERKDDIASPDELREQGKRIRERILKRKNLL